MPEIMSLTGNVAFKDLAIDYISGNGEGSSAFVGRIRKSDLGPSGLAQLRVAEFFVHIGTSFFKARIEHDRETDDFIEIAATQTAEPLWSK